MKAQRNLMVYHGWYIKYSFPTHTFYMVVYLQCTPRFFWKESSVLPMLHKHPYIPLLQSYNPILAMQYHNIWNSPSYTHVAEISRTAHCAHIADTFYVAQPFWYSKETNNGTWYHMSRKRHVICWEKDGTCIGLSIYSNVFLTQIGVISISESILWPQSPRWFAWCEVWARSWKIANWCCFPGRVTPCFDRYVCFVCQFLHVIIDFMGIYLYLVGLCEFFKKGEKQVERERKLESGQWLNNYSDMSMMLLWFWPVVCC